MSAIRIAIDEPYVASKRSLLHVVADANDVRCVFHRGVDLATLVGPVGQLAHVELLFTSLLIQVQSALIAVAADEPVGGHIRSRGPLVVHRRVRGTHRRAAADRATVELFERVVGRTTRFRSSATYDAIGVTAGASAADRAALRETGLSGTGTDTPRRLRDAS